MTNPSAPVPTSYLTSISMLDPWESLKVNTRRELLGADNAHNGGGGQGGPEVDVYDISVDCRYPQLLASKAVGTGADGGVPSPIYPNGHEGAWAPDGLTYYRGDLANAMYHAIDASDPTRPKEIASFDIATALSPLPVKSHGLSVSDDGNRAYVAVLGGLAGGVRPVGSGEQWLRGARHEPSAGAQTQRANQIDKHASCTKTAASRSTRFP